MEKNPEYAKATFVHDYQFKYSSPAEVSTNTVPEVDSFENEQLMRDLSAENAHLTEENTRLRKEIEAMQELGFKRDYSFNEMVRQYDFYKAAYEASRTIIKDIVSVIVKKEKGE